MKGDIVDLTPPTPSPMKNMVTTNPGIPAPLSKAIGKDVKNIVVAPQIKRLFQSPVSILEDEEV